MTADEAIQAIRDEQDAQCAESHGYMYHGDYREVEAAEAYLRLACAVLAEVERMNREAEPFGMFRSAGAVLSVAMDKAFPPPTATLARARATVEKEADHEQ